MDLFRLTSRQEIAIKKKENFAYTEEQLSLLENARLQLSEKMSFVPSCSANKYYYIYRITNLIHSITYIGQHYGTVKDSYLGSGYSLKADIKIYGKIAFFKEPLAIAENRDHADELEELFVDEELKRKRMCYNLMRAGKLAKLQLLVENEASTILGYQKEEGWYLPLTETEKSKLWEIVKVLPNAEEYYNKRISNYEQNLVMIKRMQEDDAQKKQEKLNIILEKQEQSKESWKQATVEQRKTIYKFLKIKDLHSEPIKVFSRTVDEWFKCIRYEKMITTREKNDKAKRIKVREEKGIPEISKKWWKKD